MVKKFDLCDNAIRRFRKNIDFWGTQDLDGILITNQLNLGSHELSFRFTFSFPGQSVRLWSNKIMLIVQ
jgi:hypothetical protein